MLIGSGLLEAVWAVALSASRGFRRPGPTVLFIVSCAISMVGLAYAVRSIPIGAAYAVWVGIGAALTVAYAMASGSEAVSVGKLIFIGGIIAAVIGLKLVPMQEKRPADPTVG